MRHTRDILWCALLLFLAGSAGCGLTGRVAVTTLVPVLEEAVDAAYRDRDVETVRAGIPGNLILIRGLAEAEPWNEDLWRLATQLYFSYAMGFIEDEDPARALLLYEEGLRLGRKGLSRNGWFRQAESERPVPAPETLALVNSKDVPLLLWTLTNWSSWIALNAHDPSAVADLPRVEAYLGRVLELEPTYFFGMPHVLAGTILTFRPPMLGGDPEAGRQHFESAFAASEGRLLLVHVLYARYYCRQVFDEECFHRNLQIVLEAPPDLLPDYQLFNEVARAKALHLQEISDDLF